MQRDPVHPVNHPGARTRKTDAPREPRHHKQDATRGHSAFASHEPFQENTLHGKLWLTATLSWALFFLKVFTLSTPLGSGSRPWDGADRPTWAPGSVVGRGTDSAKRAVGLER